MIHKMGQDGGVVSAMLIWCLEKGYIDAALVSYLEGDGSTWKAIPGVARTKEEVLAAAGSRYTYSRDADGLRRGRRRWRREDRSRRHGLPDLGRRRR